jgi:hypothetical protein
VALHLWLPEHYSFKPTTCTRSAAVCGSDVALMPSGAGLAGLVGTIEVPDSKRRFNFLLEKAGQTGRGRFG